MATYDDQMRAAERKRRIAEILRAQSMQPQLRDGGRFAVGPTALSGLAGLASALRGGYLDRKANQEEQQARTSEQARLAQAFQRMTEGNGTSQPTPQMQAAGELVQGLPLEAQQQIAERGALETLFPKQQKALEQPNSVREFEYAKQNGFKGTFQDWIIAGGQSSRPSAVKEWDFYSNLPPELQQRYLEMKRNPNFFVKDVNQVPTVVHPTVGVGTSVNPLSTQTSENAAAQERKRNEATGAEVGKAEGAIQGGIETKGANAVGVENLLDIAEPLIDVATGSGVGNAADKVAAYFGHATDGAEAINSLKTLQASLIQSMPRLEGPQSDADRQLYVEAAGQIGDPKVPAPIKKAAVKTVRAIQTKYKQRAGMQDTPPAQASQSQERKSIGGKTYVQINGDWYEDDGT